MIFIFSTLNFEVLYLINNVELHSYTNLLTIIVILS